MTRSIAVVGSGYMGGGIAQVLALAGNRVALVDVSAQAAVASRDRLLAQSDEFADAGLFPPDATERLAANLHAAESVEAGVADTNLVEEAVVEDLDVKRAVLAHISAEVSSEVIVASNTSTISIGDLAAAVALPERFLGVHFVNPAPFVPGVELIPHAGTDEAVVAATRSLLEDAGKTPVAIRDATGFVVPRLQFALLSEAAKIVEEGIAAPEDVDVLVRTTFGLRLPFFGPFAIADMSGLDVYAACYRVLQRGFPGRFETPAVLRDLVDAGRLGTKSGGGFFDVVGEEAAALTLRRDRALVAVQHLVSSLDDDGAATASDRTTAGERQIDVG